MTTKIQVTLCELDMSTIYSTRFSIGFEFEVEVTTQYKECLSIVPHDRGSLVKAAYIPRVFVHLQESQCMQVDDNIYF